MTPPMKSSRRRQRRNPLSSNQSPMSPSTKTSRDVRDRDTDATEIDDAVQTGGFAQSNSSHHIAGLNHHDVLGDLALQDIPPGEDLAAPRPQYTRSLDNQQRVQVEHRDDQPWSHANDVGDGSMSNSPPEFFVRHHKRKNQEGQIRTSQIDQRDGFYPPQPAGFYTPLSGVALRDAAQYRQAQRHADSHNESASTHRLEREVGDGSMAGQFDIGSVRSEEHFRGARRRELQLDNFHRVQRELIHGFPNSRPRNGNVSDYMRNTRDASLESLARRHAPAGVGFDDEYDDGHGLGNRAQDYRQVEDSEGANFTSYEPTPTGSDIPPICAYHQRLDQMCPPDCRGRGARR